ncbi:hypothetical protein M3221_13470 [Domibacillus indicus]|uniref:hypothetical protein n=1 Tax=Domibacillus indicus TaxID=1437523 RepID=UPI00203B58BF|nr:hypothetical protein [Domibacillus indicus]MCM3789410.1 hypothetical protein [Domibacillus indicus]
MAGPVIDSVTLTPQTVNAGQSFKIEVSVTSVITLRDLQTLTWQQVHDRGLTWRDVDEPN